MLGIPTFVMSTSFFHRQTTKNVPVATATAVAAASSSRIDTSVLTSEDPDIAAFYAQLNPQERIAHTIAIDKLGTSYDVVRTHAYTKWLKTRK